MMYGMAITVRRKLIRLFFFLFRLPGAAEIIQLRGDPWLAWLASRLASRNERDPECHLVAIKKKNTNDLLSRCTHVSHQIKWGKLKLENVCVAMVERTGQMPTPWTINYLITLWVLMHIW